MRNLNSTLEQFRSPLLRDLVWALLSPTLINANNNNYNPSPRWYREAFTLIKSHLHQLDQDDAPLQQHLNAAPNTRLGLYFEQLWSWWLLHNGRYQLLAHNLQVIDQHKTLGAFDFIVHDTHANQIEHWELAVKFYLGVPPLREAHHWFGINTNDRLDLKHQHLERKQLTLSETFPGRSLCNTRGWNIQQRRLISKGRLYHPYQNTPSETTELPRCIDPHHLSGFWLNNSDFLQQASAFPQAKYRWLDRTEWLVHHTTAQHDIHHIHTLLAQQSPAHPIQLLVSGWQPEPFRLFVVQDNWQEKALTQST